MFWTGLAIGILVGAAAVIAFLWWMASGIGPMLSLLAGSILLTSAKWSAAAVAPLVICLAPGNGTKVTDAQLKAADGLTVRTAWADLEKTPGKVDCSFIDAQAKRSADQWKPWKLLIQTGKGKSPKWIGGQWIDGAPAPWSPELRAAHARMVKRLAAGLKYRPYAVHVTGPTYPSAEMHPAPNLTKAKGWSQAAMVKAWSAAIDDYAAAFPDASLCLSISVEGVAKTYVGPVCDKLAAVAGDRAVFEHNSLKASTNPKAPHHLFLLNQKSAGRRVAFEMACSAAYEPRRFGSTNVNDGLKLGRAAGPEWFDVYPPDVAQAKK